MSKNAPGENTAHDSFLDKLQNSSLISITCQFKADVVCDEIETGRCYELLPPGLTPTGPNESS